MNPMDRPETIDILAIGREHQRRAKTQRTTKLAIWGGVAALGLARGGLLGWLLAAYGIDRSVPNSVRALVVAPADGAEAAEPSTQR